MMLIGRCADCGKFGLMHTLYMGRKYCRPCVERGREEAMLEDHIRWHQEQIDLEERWYAEKSGSLQER